jgi:uncharacterized protein (TIGR02118 family)
MLTLTCAVRRQPHLSHEEFDRYWRDVHAALIRKHAAALHIRRYVQLPVLADAAAQERIRASRGTLEAGYDGMALLWYDDLDALWAVRESPEGIAVLGQVMEDERRFVDFSRSHMWLGEEREIVSAAAA